MAKTRLKSHYLNQFKPSSTEIFQFYFQKILVWKLHSWNSVKITKNYKILVLLGLNTVYFFVREYIIAVPFNTSFTDYSIEFVQFPENWHLLMFTMVLCFTDVEKHVLFRDGFLKKSLKEKKLKVLLWTLEFSN